MYDETAVVSSPPPYTAYAAPTPEVGSKSSPYRIQVRETWGLCATVLLKQKKTLSQPVSEKSEMYCKPFSSLNFSFLNRLLSSFAFLK